MKYTEVFKELCRTIFIIQLKCNENNLQITSNLWINQRCLSSNKITMKTIQTNDCGFFHHFVFKYILQSVMYVCFIPTLISLRLDS